MNSQTACCNTPIGPSDASLSPGPKSLPEPAPVQRSHSLSSYYIIFWDALSISLVPIFICLHCLVFFSFFLLMFMRCCEHFVLTAWCLLMYVRDAEASYLLMCKLSEKEDFGVPLGMVYDRKKHTLWQESRCGLSTWTIMSSVADLNKSRKLFSECSSTK